MMRLPAVASSASGFGGVELIKRDMRDDIGVALHVASVGAGARCSERRERGSSDMSFELAVVVAARLWGSQRRTGGGPAGGALSCFLGRMSIALLRKGDDMTYKAFSKKCQTKNHLPYHNPQVHPPSRRLPPPSPLPKIRPNTWKSQRYNMQHGTAHAPGVGTSR